jgi:uncharacterized protein YdhG (YjbR/CyaY superfamily)
MSAAKKSTKGFSPEERAAMRERIREMKAQANRAEAEKDLRTKIAEMPPSDRAMAERLDRIMKATAPGLFARTWYGMPAYAKGDDIVCYFRPAEKFKTRYATFGFSDEAKLDEGHMWATDFALTELNAAEEARIVELVKRAVGPLPD